MSLLPTQGEGRDYGARYALIVIVALGTLLFLTGRLYQLQVVRGEHYARLSRSNFVKRVDIAADRGMILDNRGTIVVDGRPSYDVEITPVFAPDPHGTLDRLAEILELDDETLSRVKHRVDSTRGLDRFHPIRVRRDVGRDALDRIESHSIELDGVDVRVRPQRNYRYGTYLSHALGYMNEISADELGNRREEGLDYRLGDMIGRSGLEERFEPWLRGKDGIEQVVVDAKGRRTRLGAEDSLISVDERVLESVPGRNIVLSIDMRLQEIAEEAFPGLAGSIVAVDPQTGYVLAMVSRPSFDPNKLSGRITSGELGELAEDPLQPLINRTIQQHYTPGSTFKIVTGLAGLKTETVKGVEQGTTCRGGYRLGRRRWRCWREAGHGFVNVHTAMKRSCNTFFYWLSDQMDIDPIAESARELGFGRRTGIGLPQEIPGIVPDVEWYRENHADGYQRGFALNAAIGQGDVTSTPLQLVMAYAAVSNGGVVFKPQLVRRIEDAAGNTLKEFLPEKTNEMDVSPEKLELIVKGLRAVVHEPGGTAFWRRPRDLDVEIAGKTGTAQVVKIGAVRVPHEEREYHHRNHAIFAAFAPVDNPKIAVAVVHEHGGSGGRGAAPAAMDVLRGFFELEEQDAAERAHGRPLPLPGSEKQPAPRRRRPPPSQPDPAEPMEGFRHAGDSDPEPVPVQRPPSDISRG